MKQNQFGRSMIEMLGVLAIIAVLSVAGIAGYSKAMTKFKVNKTVDQVINIVTGIMTTFANEKGYSGAKYPNDFSSNEAEDIEMFKALGIITDDMITNGKLKHPFNGEIFIIGDNKEFELNLLNLSRESCLALATLDWGADNPNLMGISVVNSGYPITSDCSASMGGGSYLGDIGFWACKYFNEDKIIPIPVPPAIAAKACTCKENTCALGLYYNENL